jgi:hypothetical protein
MDEVASGWVTSVTITSFARRLGVAVAALQVASRRIIGRSSDSDPVISISISGEEWKVVNHGRSVAYDVQISSMTYAGLSATFPLIPCLSNIARLIPLVTADRDAFKISRGPLSRNKNDVREILLRKWSDRNGFIDDPPREEIMTIAIRYRNVDGWWFTTTADLSLTIVSRELSIRNIRNADQPEYREA